MTRAERAAAFDAEEERNREAMEDEAALKQAGSWHALRCISDGRCSCEPTTSRKAA